MNGVEYILVSYYSADHIANLLHGLPAKLPVAIIDNAGGRDDVERLINSRTNARHVDSGGGKGYAKAANLGVRSSSAKYIVFGNPDSRPTIHVITELVNHLARDPTCGSVSATTVDEHGRPELGVGGWEPTLRRTIVHAFGLHKVFPSAGIWFPPQRGEVVEREWASAACMAVKREVFIAVGGFDERYFVYNEDMALGRRLREAGLRQVIRGDLQVLHLGGGSGAGSSYMSRMRGASMITYLRQYHRPATVLLLQGVLVVGYLLRIAQCVITRRWARARGFLSYVRGLTVGRGALV